MVAASGLADRPGRCLRACDETGLPAVSPEALSHRNEAKQR